MNSHLREQLVGRDVPDIRFPFDLFSASVVFLLTQGTVKIVQATAVAKEKGRTAHRHLYLMSFYVERSVTIESTLNMFVTLITVKRH